LSVWPVHSLVGFEISINTYLTLVLEFTSKIKSSLLLKSNLCFVYFLVQSPLFVTVFVGICKIWIMSLISFGDNYFKNTI
jgi:hypothetical protein